MGAKCEWRYMGGGPKRQNKHCQVHGAIRQVPVPKLVGGVLCFSGRVPNSFLRNPGILHRAPGVSLRSHSVACLSSSRQTSVIFFFLHYKLGAMKANGGLKTLLHAYTILALDRSESLLHTPAALSVGKNRMPFG
jgi:hypothetical protein